MTLPLTYLHPASVQNRLTLCTPEERRSILASVEDACRSNPSFHVHFLADDSLAPRGCFACHEDMGVQISANRTTYVITTTRP